MTIESFHHMPQPEQSPEQQRLLQAMKQKLEIPDALTAVYDPAKGRVGTVRFVVIDSPDRTIHIALHENTQGGGVNDIGVTRYDFVRAVWWNEGTDQTGGAEYIERSEGNVFHSRTDAGPLTSDEELYWKETGGIDWLPGGLGLRPPATQQQLRDLANTIEHGHTNQEMTQGALRYLQTKWGAQQNL